MVKIVTMCSQGLCRSVGLADVLKLHFEPVDVLPFGHKGNTEETRLMLCAWADKIIVMQEHMKDKYIPVEHHHKTLVCDVGPDRYKNSKHRELIDQVWNWTRKHTKELGITEHTKSL